MKNVLAFVYILLSTPALSGQIIMPQFGHTCEVTDISQSPDGQYYATADEAGQVLIWEVSSRKIIQTLHADYFHYLDLEFDSRQWQDFYGTADSFATKNSDLSYTLPDLLTRPVFSQDNKTLTVQGRAVVYVFEIHTGKLIRAYPIHGQQATTAASPVYDTAWLAELALFTMGQYYNPVNDYTLILPDWLLLGQGQQVQMINFRFEGDYIKTLSLRPPLMFLEQDTVLLGIPTNHPDVIEAWKVDKDGPRKIGAFQGKSKIFNCLNISPDFRFLAAGGEDGKITVWSLEKISGMHKPVQVFQAHDRPVWYVSFQNVHGNIYSIARVDSLQDKWYLGKGVNKRLHPFYSPEEIERGDDVNIPLGFHDPQREYFSDSHFFFYRVYNDANSDVELYSDFAKNGSLLPEDQRPRFVGKFSPEIRGGYTPPDRLEPSINISNILASPHGRYVLLSQETTGGISGSYVNRIAFLKDGNGTAIKPFEGTADFRFSPDDRYLLVRPRRILGDDKAHSARVTLYESASGRQVFSLPQPVSSLSQIIFSSDSKHLAVVQADYITFWSLESLQPEFYVLTDERSDNVAMILPSGYYLYTGNPSVLQKLALVQNGKARSLRQFDLYLNRPDTVIAAINRILFGRISLQTRHEIELVNRALRERIRQVEQPVWGEAPFLALSEPLPSMTEQKNLRISVKAGGSRFLSEIRFWINGNPLPPSRVSGRKKAIVQTYDIPLLGGRSNIVEASVLDDAGVESQQERWVVDCTAPAHSKVYFAGVGLSRYRSGPSLVNAASDIRAIVKALRLRFGEDLIVDTLLDEAATREAVLALGQRISRCQPEDAVLFFWSGHGSLEALTQSFYLQTYLSGPGHQYPEGLSVTDLNALLDETPAQKKLLIVNACHAGENYSDLQAFKKMKTLFLDFRRSNGSTIISATGQEDDAFSARDAGNSYLTLALLAALENRTFPLSTRTITPDADGNQRVSVSELYRYLRDILQEKLLIDAEIRDLEKPAVPEMRQQNIELDFDVW